MLARQAPGGEQIVLFRRQRVKDLTISVLVLAMVIAA
jgi:hypothetical protein